MPTYNRANLIGESIEAALAQTRPVDELLVINDGSKDDTDDVVARYGDRVRLITKTNGGKATALNLALEEATGDAIWIVDDDDLIRPTAHETLAGLMEADPEAGVAYGRYIRFRIDAETGARAEMETGHWTSAAPEDFLIATMEDFFVHHPGLLVRREVYAKAGLFDVRITRSEDYDMLLRLARNARCVGTDDIVFEQRQHDGVRGPGGGQVAADAVNAKWLSDDRMIFEKVRQDFSLGAFLPGGREPQTDLETRRAVLQRGVVMARKKMWEHALQDFAEAAALSTAPLSQDEVAMLRRATGSKYGVAELLDAQDVVEALLAFKAGSPRARRIVRMIGRGLGWRVRKATRSGRTGEAAQLTRLILRLML